MKQIKEMTICIDPSTTCIGYSLFIDDGLEDFGNCKIPAKMESIDKLLYIRDFFSEYVSSKIRLYKKKLRYVFIEESFVSFARGAKKGALLVVAGTILKELFESFEAEVYKIHNRSIKKAVTGDGGAEKSSVAKEVLKQYPELRNVIQMSKKTNKMINTDISDSIAIFEAVKKIGLTKIKYKR